MIEPTIDEVEESPYAEERPVFAPPPVESEAKPDKFTPPPLDSHEGPAKTEGALSRLGSSFWEGIGGKAVMDILGGASRDPARAKKTMEAAKGIVNALANEPSRVLSELSKSGDAMIHGKIPDAMSHLGQSVPIVGAAAGQVQHDFENNDYASGFGHALGLLLPFAVGALPKGAKVPVTPKIINPNAIESAAIEYLKSEGVPISAAVETGSPYVRGVQKMADTTPLGAVVASKADAATTAALKTTADRLANRAHPSPVVPEQAGAGVVSALEAKGAGHGIDANTAYADFRKIESDPANLKTVTVGPPKQVPSGVLDASGNPIMKSLPNTQDIPLPTDVRAIKDRLRPIIEDMDKWMEPAKRTASAGYQAAKSIIDGPDYIPASQAEAGLGGLKQLARDGAGRNAGMAKITIPRLQSAIDDAVSAAGKDAVDALHSGRAATAAKYGVQSVIDQLRSEPVQTFRQMTYQKDAGIDLLRSVAKEVPGELPKIGRAYLEDLFSKAQAQGGFDGAQGLWSQWNNLGPNTKQMLFRDPQLVANLDKFFLGAKKIAEHPNPSGSGVVSWIAGQGALAVTHPVTGVPYLLGAGALSKLMHSPSGVRMLTRGMKVPVKIPEGVAVAGQLLKLAGADATPMSLPKAADSTDQTPQNEQIAAAIPLGGRE